MPVAYFSTCGGAITPIIEWRLYAGHSLAPICRSSGGSNTAVTDKPQPDFFLCGYWLSALVVATIRSAL